MVVDPARGHLYVCGGRVNEWSSEVPKFSGLYCYDAATKVWSQFPLDIFFFTGQVVDE